jgi:hypothetical protein
VGHYYRNFPAVTSLVGQARYRCYLLDTGF